MRPVSIQTSLSPYSSYLIDVVDGQLVLTTQGRVLAEVRFPKTPDSFSLFNGSQCGIWKCDEMAT